jgi:hypothetical protein
MASRKTGISNVHRFSEEKVSGLFRRAALPIASAVNVFTLVQTFPSCLNKSMR